MLVEIASINDATPSGVEHATGELNHGFRQMGVIVGGMDFPHFIPREQGCVSLFAVLDPG